MDVYQIIDNHGDLIGLTRDDHLQYVHVSGSRTIYASHQFDTGGQPFAIGSSSSGIVVVNLNADELDGYHLSEIGSSTNDPSVIVKRDSGGSFASNRATLTSLRVGGTIGPALAKICVVDSVASTAPHYDDSSVVVIEDSDLITQWLAKDTGSFAHGHLFTNTPDGAGTNKHWMVSFEGVSRENKFQLRYGTSTIATGNIAGTIDSRNPLVTLTPSGYFGFNNTNPSGQVDIYNSQASNIALTVRGAQNQLASLEEWKNYAGQTLAYVSSSGVIQASGFIGDTNANKIKGITVDETAIGAGKILTYHSELNKIVYTVPSGTVGASTASGLIQLYDTVLTAPIASGEVLVYDNGSAKWINRTPDEAMLVHASGIQNITNKTIDADLNTITNIENADIKTGAAIDAAKIADGSVSNAEFQYISTLSSNAQDQITAINAMSGVLLSHLTDLSAHIAQSSGVVVSTSGSQILYNKVIDGNYNSLLNIANASLSTGIDATKIADGSVDNTEFQYLNGATSNIQTQLNNNLAMSGVLLSHLTDLSAHIPTGSGFVVSTSGSQILFNKVIDAATNTLSNIGNTQLIAGIDAIKIADGSVDNTEFQMLGTYTHNATSSTLVSRNTYNESQFGSVVATSGIFTQYLSASGTMSFDGAVVFNESGADKDIRFEGDTLTHLLFIDASADRIGVNQSAPEKFLHVGQSNQTNNGIMIGGAGRIYFRDTSCIYESDGLVLDSANATRPIILQFNSSERARFGSTESVINETGANIDLRVESDANTHALFLDAGADSAKGLWGIRVSSPASLLDIDSTASTTVYALNLKGGDTGGGSRIFKITNALNAVIYDFRGDGTLTHNLTAAGSTYTLQFQANSRFSVSSTESVFNDVQGNYDFRIEGDSISHMLFCDATSTTENIALLATAAPNWQAMDKGIFIGNAVAAPVGNPTSGGYLYVEAGALKYRGSGGTITTVGPA